MAGVRPPLFFSTIPQYLVPPCSPRANDAHADSTSPDPPCRQDCCNALLNMHIYTQHEAWR
jgi:hypothetical protein